MYKLIYKTQFFARLKAWVAALIHDKHWCVFVWNKHQSFIISLASYHGNVACKLNKDWKATDKGFSRRNTNPMAEMMWILSMKVKENVFSVHLATNQQTMFFFKEGLLANCNLSQQIKLILIFVTIFKVCFVKKKFTKNWCACLQLQQSV